MSIYAVNQPGKMIGVYTDLDIIVMFNDFC